jgi:hypothetical protein
VIHGQMFADLGKGPVVFQVPDFGARYWVLYCMDAYTSVFAARGAWRVARGSRIKSQPGFYKIVGPDWQGIHFGHSILWWNRGNRGNSHNLRGLKLFPHVFG